VTIGKTYIFALRAVEYHATRVDPCQLVAVAEQRRRECARQLDAQAVRQNALHAGGFDPGDTFDLACGAHPEGRAKHFGCGPVQIAGEPLRG